MTPPQSLFSHQLVPLLLWPNLIWLHGITCNYHFAEGDAVNGLKILFWEGTEEEPVSPGRYARGFVDIRDLPQPPRAADWVELEWATYDVEQVSASVYNISKLILKLSGDLWQTR
jgi:hypothetical protein